MQAARPVGLLKADQARAVVAGRRRQDVACHQDETGLVVRMVLHPLHERLEPVQAPRQRRRDGGGPVCRRLADEPGRLGGRGRRHELGAAQTILQEAPGLGEGDRDRDDPSDGGELGARRREQVEVDVEHVLELDVQLDVEDEVIEGRADRALDRVLDRDEGGIDLPIVRRVERVGDGRHRDRLGTGELRDRQERLLAEGARGPEKRDPSPRLRHRRHAGRIVMPMDELELRGLIDDLRSGACSPDDAVRRLRRLPFAELGFAKVDHHRALRQGLPEAVYGAGQDPGAVRGDRRGAASSAAAGPVLLTRADEAQVAASLEASPGGARTPAEAVPGRLTTVVWRPQPDRPGRLLVCTAGTADLPVAEECAGRRSAPSASARPCSPTAGWPASIDSSRRSTSSPTPTPSSSWPGWRVRSRASSAGLTPAPVVAVPTSVGYGASLEGVTALARDARLVRRRDDRRRHRQRLRRRLRRGEDAAVTGGPAGASPGSTASPASPATWHSAASSTPGADLRELERLLDRLPIGGWSLDFEPVLRGGIAATRAIVEARGDGVVRTFPHVVGIIEEARLPSGVRDRAVAAFSLLAEVEGRLHRRPPSQVHFHEVGGHDTIVDIVGTASALELLGVEQVAASPVATGLGMVRSAHGLLPNPAPAVVELLEGIPTDGRDLNVELTTPTGAAILATWGSSFGPMPAMTIEASGFGAGAREIDGLPNCTQVVIGLPAASMRTRPRRGSATRPARGEPRRRHRRDARRRRRGAARRRRARRLGHAGAHEEGQTGPRRQRPL